ncbi:MAG: energy-coupling factor ABC transporter ATP-binding protein [Firmicutes bacterium]|nr:energy-coupling factor ABC transporter ATP-binding protein [Bacillota bacterium]
MDYAVYVKCLKHRYPDRTEVSLCGLDFAVEMGEKVVVLGPNGSGKTTLLLHVAGLLRPVEGEVRVLGVEPARFSEIRRRVGVVLQRPEEQIIGPTVWDDVAFAPRNHGVKGAELEAVVDSILEETGIAHLRKKVPHYLSGGEKKKVALAGAMVLRPDLLILDEPFEGLDHRSRLEIADLLERSNSKLGTTLVITAHDVRGVPLTADAVYIIAEGGILFRGTPREVLARCDLLGDAGLEPPMLSELALELRRAGIDIGAPVTVAEARDALVRAFRRGAAAGG